jgi:aminoglycoside phosphotransferase (APT) family kinase protein
MIGSIVLELADVAGYLLQRELVSPSTVVDGGLRVVDASKLNRVFVVSAEGERGLVLKLAGDADDPGVAQEAAVLGRLPPAPWRPRLVEYDADAGVLIMEAAPGARDLARHHGAGRFPLGLAARTGQALGALHSLPMSVLDGLPALPRWTLDVHRPDLYAVRAMSGAALELTANVQSSGELCALLDALADDACEESLVHGDVRWENCLALRSAGRWSRLLLIDWEMARPGDPAEDVGAFLGEYLRFWLASMPEQLAPGEARHPLAQMQPAIGAFWDAYARGRGRPADEPSPVLRRAVRFAAVRLLAAAFEESQRYADVQARANDALHLARNILRRPDEAAAHLLGLRTVAWA